MAIRKDDPAHPVKSRRPVLEKNGVGASESDLALNGQAPPGPYIQDQLEAPHTKRIAGLKVKSAASVLASGTKNLD